MLAVLRIQNLAIIEDLELELLPGMNVLTGETGAGKSIILRGIELLLGGRASAELIRNGSERCVVEGLFYPSAELISRLQVIDAEIAQSCQSSPKFADGEGATNSGELVLRRVIERSGRGKVYINGLLSTTALLQQIASELIDITSQRSQQSLLDEAQHRVFLDQFGVPAELVQQARDSFHAFRKAEDDLQRYLTDREALLKRQGELQQVFEELQGAGLRPGEREELERELSRLGNFEVLNQVCTECLNALAEEPSSVDNTLRRLLASLERAAELDNELSEIYRLLQSAAVEIDEVARGLSGYQSSLESDPAHLEFLRARIAEIARLERKYSRPLQELIEYREQLQRELSLLEGEALDENSLRQRAEQASQAMEADHAKLGKVRREVALTLSAAIEAGLKDLAMKRARFVVDVSEQSPGATGRDKVIFTLAANPGEPFRPLEKVASGGELSRILLVLKTVLRQVRLAGTQIFDEIDSGVGGAVAQVVGEKLKLLSSNSQILLITHAPQIAALADRQLVVSKETTNDRTRSKVQVVEEEQRVQQIAAMLAGRKVSDNFQHSARELLEVNTLPAKGD